MDETTMIDTARRADPGVHFRLLSFWSSEDSLANFASADLEGMKPCAEEMSLLIVFESAA